ncbi:MAG: sulfotransferase family protein [Gammaproteobacteria bacterium]
MSKKIFIIGTGRSGTHWIGYILARHAEIRATIEIKPAFDWVTEMALNPATRHRLFPRLVRYYRRQHFLAVPRHYMDKSHPNIWLAEKLAATFDDAVFVGMQRNPYATVASMLRHKGVLKWQERWSEFPTPNPFLGITDERITRYGRLPLAQRCAMRWRSHKQQLEYLQGVLKDRLFVIQYEELATQTRPVLACLNKFLSLSSAIPMPEIKTASVDKWQEQLSDVEIEQVAAGLADAPAQPLSRA